MTLSWYVDASTADKIVLLALSDNANDEGQCYPSVATLSRKCSMGRATVFRAMEALERAGHMHREQRAGRSTIYHIHPQVDPSQIETRTRLKLRRVLKSDPSHPETPPVPDRDTPRLTVRPHPSHPETHNHQGTITEPSEEASAPLTGHPGFDQAHNWRATPGLNVPAFASWLDDRMQMPGAKPLSRRAMLAQAKRLAATGSHEHQAALIDEHRTRDWQHIVPLSPEQLFSET